jgi:hypothetical protein
MSSPSTAASLTQPSDGGAPRRALDEYLCERAREELDTLRATLDMRLSALEAGVANPDQGESLEGLVLDLARAATVETEAAALRACLEIQLEAQAQVAEIEASVHAVSRQEGARDTPSHAVLEETRSMLEREQATGIELRSALKAAARRIVGLEREHMRATLEGEQGAILELREALEQAQGRVSGFESEKQLEIGALRQRLSAELDHQRAQAVESAAALANAQQVLETLQSEARTHQTNFGAACEQLDVLGKKLANAEERIRTLELDLQSHRALQQRVPQPVPAEAVLPRPEAVQPPAPSRYPVARQAVRYAFREEVSLEIDGSRCLVIDLSVTGSQVLSTMTLRPNRVVRVVLPLRNPIVCEGKVVWARLEVCPANASPCYRAGLSFPNEDEPAIKAFLAGHTAANPRN